MSDYEIPVDSFDEEDFKAEAKITAFNYILAYLDDNYNLENHFSRAGAKIRVTNPIPIVSGVREVGSANVFLKDGIVSCEAFLDYQTPERFDIDNSRALYLKIQGSNIVQTKKITYSNFLEPERISCMVIDKLEITQEKPADPRVGKIV